MDYRKSYHEESGCNGVSLSVLLCELSVLFVFGRRKVCFLFSWLPVMLLDICIFPVLFAMSPSTLMGDRNA